MSKLERNTTGLEDILQAVNNLPSVESGGVYIPSVTQPDANTMQVSFTPSKSNMVPVEPTDIELPSGESVLIDDIVESFVDGGHNTITFSDGKTMTVRNGKSGVHVGSDTPPVGTIVQVDPESEETFTIPDVLQSFGDSEVDTISQKALTEALNRITTLPYGGSKEWLENNGDKSQLYHIDGYIWAYIESNGWTRSSRQFVIVSSESEMTEAGDVEYLLKSDSNGTVYSYTAPSGEAGIPVYDSLPTTANNGDIIAVGNRKYKATVTTEEVPNYVNQLPIATDTDGSVFNGKGYSNTGKRINSSGNVADVSGGGNSVATGFIPVKIGDVVRIKNAIIDVDYTGAGAFNNSFYEEDKTFIVSGNWTTLNPDNLSGALYKSSTLDADGNVSQFKINNSTTLVSHGVGFMRFTLLDVSADSIITVNEEITSQISTVVKWNDIGEYVPYVAGGWSPTTETYTVVSSLSDDATDGDVAVHSTTGYLYTYMDGSSWMQTSKYTLPTISIDGELSDTSTNAVQSKAVKKAVDDLVAEISINSEGIEDLNDKLNNLVIPEADESNSVPSYWKEAVDGLAGKMKTIQANGSKVFQFIWFSDMHGAGTFNNLHYSQPTAGISSTANIGKVAQYAADRYNIPFVALSGDVMSQMSHPDVSSVYAEYENIREVLSPIERSKFLCTKGNHDGAWGAPVDGVSYLNNIGNDENYNTIYRRQASEINRVFGGNGTYFYVDSFPQKVRFIVLNCHTDGDGSRGEDGYPIYNAMKNSVYGSEQLAWVSKVLLDLPEDWCAITMSHVPLNTGTDGDVLSGLLDAYNKRRTYSKTKDVKSTYWGANVTDDTYTKTVVNVDFTSAKGKVIASFHGHIHGDRVYTTFYTFPMITITTAGGDVRDTDPVTRVVGTATETAMDIVSIDMKDKVIYCTRLGAGSDRTATYSV